MPGSVLGTGISTVRGDPSLQSLSTNAGAEMSVHKSNRWQAADGKPTGVSHRVLKISSWVWKDAGELSRVSHQGEVGRSGDAPGKVIESRGARRDDEDTRESRWGGEQQGATYQQGKEDCSGPNLRVRCVFEGPHFTYRDSILYCDLLRRVGNLLGQPFSLLRTSGHYWVLNINNWCCF